MKKILFAFMVFGLCFVLVGCGQYFEAPQNVNVYTMSIEYDCDAKNVSGNLNINYINQTETVLDCVKFHLYPNAFREGAKAQVVSLANSQKAYPNGKNYGKITIKSAKISQNDCNFVIEGEDENILSIPLESELFPNERVKIFIEFETKLANINHRLGYGENCINICNFYPIACVYENGAFVTDLYNSNGDPFYSKISTYDITFTYDEKYVLASTGETEIKKDNNKNIAHINAKGVRDFAMVLSDKFMVESDSVGDVCVNYFYIKDKSAKDSLDVAKQAVDFFEKNIGEYPYKTLNVVETSFVHGGMEYPNIVLISDDIADYEIYKQVIVHEIAHQWWYGVVGNNQYSYGWLDEGLTEYTTALFYDYYSNSTITSEQIIRNATMAYSTFMRVYSDVLGEVDTSMNRKLNEFSTEPEYVYNTYTKGLLMFATINDIVGDNVFFKSLQYYYKKNAFKEVLPQDMIACFCKASGQDLENLFNAWIQGRVVIVAPE